MNPYLIALAVFSFSGVALHYFKPRKVYTIVQIGSGSLTKKQATKVRKQLESQGVENVIVVDSDTAIYTTA